MKASTMLCSLMALLIVTPIGCAYGSDETPAARRDANRFILEKLQRESGEGWERSGQFFLWHYEFSKDGCELSMRRESLEGGPEVRQIVPMADVVPVWTGKGSLNLYCQSTSDCIELRSIGGARDNEEHLGETQLLVPQPDDLPKLKDALIELHRLCDDAYSRQP